MLLSDPFLEEKNNFLQIGAIWNILKCHLCVLKMENRRTIKQLKEISLYFWAETNYLLTDMTLHAHVLLTTTNP